LTIDYINRLTYIKLLLSVEGVGPLKIFSIISKVKKFENVFTSGNSILKVEGISNILANRILAVHKDFENMKAEVEHEIENLQLVKARIISYWDEEYPELLKKIYFPPILIYIIGTLKDLENTIAIVGTRNPTNYGKIQAERFAFDLAQSGITIVSGLARGIDSISHQAALKANGKTIAIIGSGLDVIYPPENKKLFYEIAETGLIISEYPLGTKPDAQNFPRRNRIISGISKGTLIIETQMNGGAMQTAAYALDQNREVFAIPGNITSKQSDGPNSLIQRCEAKLVLNPFDILSELNFFQTGRDTNLKKTDQADLNMFEAKINNHLNFEPIHIDDLANQLNMAISDCLVNLLTLEFKGLVKQLPGKMFIKI
jgi:DNA processing protein